MEKIKYQQISYNDFIKLEQNPNISMDYFSKFLFNGSRRGIIDENIEKLSLLFKEIDTFISYLKDNIHNVLDDMKISSDDRYEKIRYLYRIDMYKDCKNFEYGDFYLSTNFLTAISFSNLSAGELCELAYLCAIDIKNLNIIFKDESINNIMDDIIKKHEKYGKTERVVLAIRNVSFNDLKTESGNDYLYEYQKENLYDCIVSLKEENNGNVRLSNLSKYDFYLISEKEFLKFIPLLTDIREDELVELKKSYSHNFDFLFK